MEYREIYDWGTAVLAAAGIEDAALDARLLLEHICGTDRNVLLAHADREVSAAEEEQYRELTAKRAEHIPLQHLMGEQDFMGLTFIVNEKVLIPRQDTEILVEEVMRSLHDGMRILDMCTGSGCILLSLLWYSNDCEGVGADISEYALAAANENYERIKEKKPEMSAVFIKSDLFEKVEGTYDRIVANPPYIETSVIETLMPEVREHEPKIALDGGEDGLHYYREIIKAAKEHLVHGGMLYLEIGCGQADKVTIVMEKEGFCGISVVRDYAGHDRVVYGVWR